jgi:hypothetical protein
VVRGLARALDADDFEAAARHLSPACRYQARGEVLAGREQIIASYAGSSRWGREHLASLSYESEIEPPRGGEVPVLFIDHLTHGGRTHRYRCRQRFTVGEDGLVSLIVHEEIPGEREALEAFFRDCGVADRP